MYFINMYFDKYINKLRDKLADRNFYNPIRVNEHTVHTPSKEIKLTEKEA